MKRRKRGKGDFIWMKEGGKSTKGHVMGINMNMKYRGSGKGKRAEKRREENSDEEE